MARTPSSARTSKSSKSRAVIYPPDGLLRVLLTVLTAGWMILSAFTFGNNAVMGAFFMGMGWLSMRMLLVLMVAPPVVVWGRGLNIPPLRVRSWPLVIGGIGALLLLAETNAHLITSLLLQSWVQLLLLVGGIIALVAGLWPRVTQALPCNGAVDAVAPHENLSVRAQVALMFVITLLALLSRLYHLETAVHYFIDEMNFARAVWRAVDADYVPLVAPFDRIAAFPWIYPYWQTWGEALFGPSLTALRVVSVVFGTLSIPAVYLLTHEISDNKTALLAALLLAALPPHMHFSRIGINNIADPLFGVLLFYFFLRALKYQQQRDYVLAGVMLGLTQYFYEGGRLLFPLMMLFWLAWLTFKPQNSVRLDAVVARRIGLTAAMGFIVAAPIYIVLLVGDLSLLSRFDTTGISSNFYRVLRQTDYAQSLGQHLTWPFLIYVQMPDVSLFYGGETPLMLVYCVPFFLLGMGYALWHLRQPGMLLLLLWVLGTSAGSAALVSSGNAARFVVVLPALAMLMALGVRFIMLHLLPNRWHLPLMLGIGAVLAAGQVTYYFNTHLEVYNQQLRREYDAQDALFRVADFPDEQATIEVCLVADFPLDDAYLGEMREFLQLENPLCYLQPGDIPPVVRTTAYFLMPEDAASLQRLQTYGETDGPTYSPYTTVPREHQFALYLLSPP